jgi:ribosomal protein S12 methylthiotransferase accessory factor
MTSDVGIPAYMCEIMDASDDPLRALYAAAGMGCHPSRRIALLRALTEAAQERVARIAGTRDDLFRHGYERGRSLDVLRHHRTALSTGGARSFATAPTFESETFDEDVKWELQRLRSVGIQEVIAVDLTRTDFHVPVVYVLVPGLEGPSWVDEYTPGPRARARSSVGSRN